MKANYSALLVLFLPCLSFSQNCPGWLYLPNQPSYARIGDLDVPGNTITVEAFFKRTAPWNGVDLYQGDLVSKHRNPWDVNYLLRPSSAEITTTNGYFKTPEICPIELNKNYHAAMVYDGRTLKFYRNGFLMSQIAASGNLFQNNFITQIGLYDDLIIPEQLVGYITEVRIWNVARTQNEIRTYMNQPLSSPQTFPGLLAYYTFTDLKNKQGNAAWDGTLGGSAVVNGNNPDCSFIADSCGKIPVIDVCSNAGLTFSINTVQPKCMGQANGSINLSATGIYGPFHYRLNNGPFQSNSAFNGLSEGTYAITVKDAKGCTKDTSVKIMGSIWPNPIVKTGSDANICANEQIQLSATGASTYQWLPSTGLSNPNIADPVASPPVSTQYVVTGVDANGCSSSDTVFIAVTPVPRIKLIEDTVICKGSTVRLVRSSVNVKNVIWEPSTDLTDPTNINTLAVPVETTQYFVTAQNDRCSVQDSVLVVVADKPEVVLTKSNDINCTETVTQLSTNVAGTFTWAPSESLNNPFSPQPIASPSHTTAYTVQIKHNNGCISTDSITVYVTAEGTGQNRYVPNAFTPNGDGKNDCFGIKHWGAVTSLKFSVFNRWGERVFFTTSSNTCWDGTFKGVDQPADTYVFHIEAKSLCGDIVKKGTFQLIR